MFGVFNSDIISESYRRDGHDEGRGKSSLSFKSESCIGRCVSFGVVPGAGRRPRQGSYPGFHNVRLPRKEGGLVRPGRFLQKGSRCDSLMDSQN